MKENKIWLQSFSISGAEKRWDASGEQGENDSIYNYNRKKKKNSSAKYDNGVGYFKVSFWARFLKRKTQFEI